jgi:hypothetical protein
MKQVYVAHAKDFDYRNELYLPLRESELNERYKIVLPHEHSDALFSSKEFFRDWCNIFVVEATIPKLGVGIEIGWADSYGLPIIGMHRRGSKFSGSLRPMCKSVFDYESSAEMIDKLKKDLDALS